MQVLSNTFYFIVALGLLVTVHEFGHFWVARKLGVKVLTFSIGFGQALWQRKGKDGVNYVIAAIPLGGYVKMLDEREGPVEPGELPLAFNQKSVWVRIAIVLAGPLANFILAILLYWGMFLMGVSGLSTQLGEVEPGSIAARAGVLENDRITAVDQIDVHLMQDVVQAMARRIGETDSMVLTLDRNGRDVELDLPLKNWILDNERPDLLKSLGLKHKLYNQVLPPVISSVSEGSPAEQAGLQKGDVISGFNDQQINNWSGLVELIRANPDKPVLLKVIRASEPLQFSVVLGSRQHQGALIGNLGVSVENYLASRRGGWFESLGLALSETHKMIGLTVKLFFKLFSGDLSYKSLGGPLSIAEGAGETARSGLVYFIGFLAMISVNLGFINLLPIPLLDGGHLMFFLIEAIKGKPLNERVQEVGTQIGMLIVFSLMAVAIFNDLSRL